MPDLKLPNDLWVAGVSVEDEEELHYSCSDPLSSIRLGAATTTINIMQRTMLRTLVLSHYDLMKARTARCSHQRFIETVDKQHQ
ncbi:hypothetical protein KIN20_023659 [Parelaphostrongylus tenuis]|uniref:Uncharacterized protein n=1 Tax=Parelaphostrongylus tenuis TaxID=148309 RepID=A0AAD5NCB9_PARTN|nr:hypothetical protein KIN20_023659 [Parelaphostrongylus tenuis]